MSRSSSSSRLFWKRRNYGRFVGVVGRVVFRSVVKQRQWRRRRRRRRDTPRSRRTFVRGSKRTRTRSNNAHAHVEKHPRDTRVHVRDRDRSRAHTNPFYLFTRAFLRPTFLFRCHICKNVTRDNRPVRQDNFFFFASRHCFFYSFGGDSREQQTRWAGKSSQKRNLSTRE